MSCSMSSVSDIKLIRTDTTLDLSQKAEKRWPKWPTSARVLHGSCAEDMVVLLQTHPSICLDQNASLQVQRHNAKPSLLTAVVTDLSCSLGTDQLTNQGCFSIALTKEQIFAIYSLSTTIPQGKHRFSSDHRS